MLYKRKTFTQIVNTEKPFIEEIDFIKQRRSSHRIHAKNKVPSFLGLDKKSSRDLAKKLNIKIKSTGIGVVVKQNPKKGSALSKNIIVNLKYKAPAHD